MRIKFFPVNSKTSYIIYEDHDKMDELEQFMKEKNISRIIFSGSLGYKKSILPFNEDIDFIEEVLIQNSNITDLTPLYYLTNLKKISIEENLAFANPFDLRRISKLTDFFTDNTLNIDGYFDHPTLQHLHIEPKKIKRLEISKENNILESLSIANSHIIDISDCIKLTRLKGLYLAYLPKIEDIIFILNIPTLIDIEICSCKKINNLIEILSQKNNLQTLTIWNQGNLDSIVPFSKLEYLTSLNIWEQTKIIDGKISFLNKMKNLKKIDIRKYAHYN